MSRLLSRGGLGPLGTDFAARFEDLVDAFVTELRRSEIDLFRAGWVAGLGSARWLREHGLDPNVLAGPVDRARADLFFATVPRLIERAQRDALVARFGCFIVGYLRGVGTGEALEEYIYLGDVGRALTSAGDPEEVFRIATDAAIVLYRADGASIACREGGVWRIAYQHGVSDELTRLEFRDEVLDGFTPLLSDEAVFYDDLDLASGLVGRIAGRFGARSVISTPLMIAGECIGALTAQRNAVLPFSERDQAAMHVLALQTAANLREKRDAAQLRRSEARLRRLVESNVVGIGVSTRDGRIVEANDGLLDMVGYERADVAEGRLRWDSITAPQSRNVTREMMARLREHGVSPPAEKEYLRKDGSRVAAVIGAATIPDSGGQNIFYALDVTQRRRVEHVMRALSAARGFSSLDERTIVQEFAALAAETIAEWCGVFFVVENAIHPVAFGHRDADKLAMVERTLRDRPLSENDPSAIAVRTGRPVILTKIDDATLVGFARDAEHLEVLRILGPRSVMVVPLIVHGRTIGGLSLMSSAESGAFTGADVPLAELLAQRDRARGRIASGPLHRWADGVFAQLPRRRTTTQRSDCSHRHRDGVALRTSDRKRRARRVCGAGRCRDFNGSNGTWTKRLGRPVQSLIVRKVA